MADSPESIQRELDGLRKKLAEAKNVRVGALERPLPEAAINRIKEQIADAERRLAAASGPTAADQIQGNYNDFYYGTPTQQNAYNQDRYTGVLGEIAQATGTPGYIGGLVPVPQQQGIQQPGFLANADRRDQGIIDGLEGQLGGINSGLRDRFSALDASDQSAYDMLNDRLGAIEPLTAQQWASNPADQARQIDAYDMLMGVAGGSMDAHSNPQDVAAQAKNRDLAWDLAKSPQLTAEERFIYEKQRQIEEQDRRGYVDAKMRDLANRGQLGSGHEIGANLGAQQITSQNRVLGDLGALANAVQRQMNALAQHGNISTNMRNASDAMSTGNMNRRSSGAIAAGNQSNAIRQANDVVGMFNADSVNTTAQFNQNMQRGIAGDQFAGQTRINESAGGRAGQLAGNETAAAGSVAGARLDAGASSDRRAEGASDRGIDIMRLAEDWAGRDADRDRSAQEYEDALESQKNSFNVLKPRTWL